MMITLSNDLVNEIINFTPWYTLVRNDIVDSSGIVEEFMKSTFASEVCGDDPEIVSSILVEKISSWLESVTEYDIENWANKIGVLNLYREYDNTYKTIDISIHIHNNSDLLIYGWFLFSYICNRTKFQLANF
jgi:hypothetical protein